MKSFTKYLLKLLVIILIPANSYSTTIKETLSAAYNYSPEIFASYQNIKTNDELIRQAFSGWLPNISLDLAYTNEDNTFDIDKIDKKEEISLTQNLFRGGETILSVKKAEYNSLASKYNFLTIVQKTLLDSIIAHVDVIRNYKILQLSKRNLKAFKKYQKITNERFTFKEVSKTDIAQAKASVSTARRDLIIAEGNLKISKSQYKQITGIKPVDLEVIDHGPNLPSTDLDTLLKIALKENPVIKIAENNLKALKRNVTLQKSYLLPKVDLSVKKSHEEFTNASSATSEYIGVNIKIPIYQSGSKYSKIRQSKFEAEKQKQVLKQVKLKVIQDTIRSYENLNTSKASIEANKISIDALSTALEGTINEAKFGERTTLDVLEAEFRLFKAKNDLISAERDEIINAYSLLLQVGRLNKKELDLKIKSYDPDEYRKNVKYKFIGF